MGKDYAKGATECALGVINKDEKYLGIFEFCLWYNELLKKEGHPAMKARYDDLDEYIADLKAEIAQNEQCATHYYNLGLALLTKRDFVAAEESFLNAVRNSPHLAEAYVQLGGICLERGDLDGCLRYNEEAANCRAKFPVPWSNICLRPPAARRTGQGRHRP